MWPGARTHDLWLWHLILTTELFCQIFRVIYITFCYNIFFEHFNCNITIVRMFTVVKLITCLPLAAPLSAMRETTACYGTAEDCAYYTLDCNDSEIIRIEDLYVGRKDQEVFLMLRFNYQLHPPGCLNTCGATATDHKVTDNR